MRRGAIILTGGASRRMGTDKAALVWFGRRAIDRVVEVATLCGADPVFTVGTQDYGFSNLIDGQPGGGPVGGILTGMAALSAAGCTQALVLAVDAPMLRPDDLMPLMKSEDPGAAYAGLHLPMVLAIAALPAEAQAGWPVGRLIERAGLVRLICPIDRLESLRGANTPLERETLIGRMKDER